MKPGPPPPGAPLDWRALHRLRAVFLEGAGGERDYWQTESDLAAYDATFAQRIGWKWEHVLGELDRRGWQPPAGAVLDWGCGSGIAARVYLDHYGPEAATSVCFWDRSPLARRYAAARARAKYPALEVGERPSAGPSVVLVSHVLTELDELQARELESWLVGAQAILWVEPGMPEVSRRLIAARESLRRVFHVVAPCTHAAACGLLAPGNEPHWCHQFASPPPAVFTDAFWGRFAREIGVDLRSLPVSYLALDRRPPPPLPAGAVRVIGRPRVDKPQARALACDADGVAEYTLTRRALPEVYQRWRKGDCPGLQVWERDGASIRVVRLPGCAAAAPTAGETGGAGSGSAAGPASPS